MTDNRELLEEISASLRLLAEARSGNGFNSAHITAVVSSMALLLTGGLQFANVKEDIAAIRARQDDIRTRLPQLEAAEHALDENGSKHSQISLARIEQKLSEIENLLHQYIALKK